MTLTVLGYVILISIEFYDFSSPIDMSSTGDSVWIIFPNTSDFVKLKYSAARRIFSSPLGVWKCGQTPSFVCDAVVMLKQPLETTQKWQQIKSYLSENNTHTAVGNMTLKRMLENKIHLTCGFVCLDSHLFRVEVTKEILNLK